MVIQKGQFPVQEAFVGNEFVIILFLLGLAVAPRDFVRLYVRIFEAWKAIINRSPYHICLGDVCRAHQLNSFCNPGSRSG